MPDRPERQCDGQVCLAHTGRSEQQDVGGFGDEGEAGQLLDLALVDGGLEGEVELLQGALEGQMCELGSRGEVVLPAGVDLHAQQLGEHLRVGQLLAGGRVQRMVERFGSLLEPQALQMLTGLLQGDHRTPPRAASS